MSTGQPTVQHHTMQQQQHHTIAHQQPQQHLTQQQQDEQLLDAVQQAIQQQQVPQMPQVPQVSTFSVSERVPQASWVSQVPHVSISCTTVGSPGSSDSWGSTLVFKFRAEVSKSPKHGWLHKKIFVSNKTKVNGVVLSTGGAPGSGGRGRPAAVPVTGG